MTSVMTVNLETAPPAAWHYIATDSVMLEASDPLLRGIGVVSQATARSLRKVKATTLTSATGLRRDDLGEVTTSAPTQQGYSGIKPLPFPINYVNKDAVEEFLTRRTFLVSTMWNALAVLASYFGGAPVELEVVDYFDIDDPAERQVLLVRVLSERSAAESVATLNRFDMDWWLQKDREIRRLLCITLG